MQLYRAPLSPFALQCLQDATLPGSAQGVHSKYLIAFLLRVVSHLRLMGIYYDLIHTEIPLRNHGEGLIHYFWNLMGEDRRPILVSYRSIDSQ